MNKYTEALNIIMMLKRELYENIAHGLIQKRSANWNHAELEELDVLDNLEKRMHEGYMLNDEKESEE